MAIDNRARLTVGDHVYCFDRCGVSMIIYSLTTRVWKQLEVGCSSWCRLVEHEGKNMKVEQKEPNARSVKIYRYNDTALRWDRLNDNDVKDISWFFLRVHASYSVKGEGSKGYFLQAKRTGKFRMTGALYGYQIEVYNLKDGSKEILSQDVYLPFCRVGRYGMITRICYCSEVRHDVFD
ncbi:unnamed protein product [Dovyalis caffra]|uniref:Uncharacterized protein n=1 Tax=Dovyalis caffra TaxID=77055 RepID=A0AAV1RSK9_9ROSI|nr:unnamed protein product [Dovyalis caffra]